MGMVYDSGLRALRPIIGLPGAAMVGKPLAAATHFARAWAAPVRNYAIAIRIQDSALVLIRVFGATSGEILLPQTGETPSAVAFSPGGSAAALLLAGSGRVAVLAGLPDSPHVHSTLPLPEQAGALAVSDDGSAAVAAAGPKESQALYRLQVDTSVRLPGAFGEITAIRFADSGRQLLVADASSGSIYLLDFIGLSANTSLLASPGDGLSRPSDVAVSADGRWVFVAGGSPNVIAFDRQGGPPVVLECACEPVSLTRLATANTFLLNSSPASPLWVLDAGSGGPRLLAVPPEPPGDPAAEPETGARP
jgi:DNA-binding beta-propeller fold protein YncE